MSGQSLYRHLRNWYRVGVKDGWAQLNEWVDVKSGVLKGTDKLVAFTNLCCSFNNTSFLLGLVIDIMRIWKRICLRFHVS